MRNWPQVMWRFPVSSVLVDVKTRVPNFVLASRVKYHTECTSYEHRAVSYYLPWCCNKCLCYLRGPFYLIL